ncbi:hypothetical protein ALC53_11315 [Atta colombica]|uniref:Uncharacterized protein n=1 Tax=Atta colombica TaxID=520822 RepID=A0A151I0D4_9HYME|nr:hypothetical protein ALC53_11315 [Atta colombica]
MRVTRGCPVILIGFGSSPELRRDRGGDRGRLTSHDIRAIPLSARFNRERNEIWFMHDGAPAHFSRTVREFLNNNYINNNYINSWIEEDSLLACT